MLDTSKWVLPLGLMALAGCANNVQCSCGLASGEVVQVTAPPGGCEAGASPPYEYCVETGPAESPVSPFYVEPRLGSRPDSAAPWPGPLVPRSWDPRGS